MATNSLKFTTHEGVEKTVPVDTVRLIVDRRRKIDYRFTEMVAYELRLRTKMLGQVYFARSGFCDAHVAAHVHGKN